MNSVLCSKLFKTQASINAASPPAKATQQFDQSCWDKEPLISISSGGGSQPHHHSAVGQAWRLGKSRCR